MNHADQLSLPLGRKARDAGLAQTASKNTEWTIANLIALHLFVARRGNCEFTMEIFRGERQLRNTPAPSSPHAWGALTTAAHRSGLIEWTGRYIQASSKKTHAHPVKVWRRGPSTKGAS